MRQFTVATVPPEECIRRVLQYENFPALQTLVMDGVVVCLRSRLADLAATLKDPTQPKLVASPVKDAVQPKQVVPAIKEVAQVESVARTPQKEEAFTLQFRVNGVTFALTGKAKADKAEVQIALKRVSGQYASFWERRDRDISLPVLFNDETYTVAVDAAATVAQLKSAAVLVTSQRETEA